MSGTHQGEWLHENVTFTLRELCDSAGTNAAFIQALVRHGLIGPVNVRPHAEQAARWRFDAQALHRSRRAARMGRDLRLNLPGIALAIELLDSLQEQQVELSRLRRLLDRRGDSD